MSAIDYTEVTVVVDPNEPWTDLLIAEFGELGFESFQETLEGFKAYIPTVDFNAELLNQISLAEDEQGLVHYSFSIKKIDSQNWNQIWESNFEPVDVEGQCYIRAPFHTPKHNYPYEIIIEPKMSFGTGHHETTTLMVQWGLETDFASKAVLDMGCGTGILAILAAIRGANPVTAIDNYIFAYENTVENIQRNNTPDIEVLHGDASLLGDTMYDIVLANITRNVLMEDIPKFVEVLNPQGELFMSGFFAQDMPDIVGQAESCGMKFLGYKQNKEWVAVRLIKA